LARDHHAVYRRDDVGEAQVHLRRVERGLPLGDGGLVEDHLALGLVAQAERVVDRVMRDRIELQQPGVAGIGQVGVLQAGAVLDQLRPGAVQRRARLGGGQLVGAGIDRRADLTLADRGVVVAAKRVDRAGDERAHLHRHLGIDAAAGGDRALDSAAFHRGGRIGDRLGAQSVPGGQSASRQRDDGEQSGQDFPGEFAFHSQGLPVRSAPRLDLAQRRRARVRLLLRRGTRQDEAMSDLPDLKPGGAYSGHNLSNIDFAERDLSEISLTNCVLIDTQLSAVILQSARFIDCRFVRCRFAHADLRETVFTRCNFADPDSHSGVQIAFSQMDQAAFEACDLSFADIDRTSLWAVAFKSTNLRGARFHRADFTRSFGGKTVRTAAAFTACNLELCDLSDARLATCDLSGSSLREADLTGADLEGADLTGCDFFQALTAGAKLADADLRGAHVSGLDLAALATYAGAKISLSQQQALLTAMGLDVYAD
jgi:fluoroquinolone resistance protein